MSRAIRWILPILMLGLLESTAAAAEFPGPFFFSGDGVFTLQGRQGGQVRVTYRRAGHYDDAALRKINAQFGAPWERPTERVGLRLIELLDHVQDRFGGAPIILMSGYRSPESNARLRALGRLAAQSSLHMEGEAIDCHLQGVASAEVYAYIKGLNCCGVGYYHGREVHIDTGPARYWDEVTSGTEDREPQQNAKIMVVTDRDRYRVGETVMLRFLRITDYPVLVPGELTMEWRPAEAREEAAWKTYPIVPAYVAQPRRSGCVPLGGRTEAKSVRWTVARPPRREGPIRARLRARFCERVSEKMPADIVTNIFEIW